MAWLVSNGTAGSTATKGFLSAALRASLACCCRYDLFFFEDQGPLILRSVSRSFQFSQHSQIAGKPSMRLGLGARLEVFKLGVVTTEPVRVAVSDAAAVCMPFSCYDSRLQQRWHTGHGCQIL